MFDELFTRHFWRNPPVRHLAWMATAPSMINGPQRLLFSPPAPPDLREHLLALDRQPAELHRILERRSTRRLGVYFEALYRYALEHLWHRETIFQNLAVQDGGRTLGELDFIVRDRISDRHEHHEIAVKFYLGTPSGQWLGPDQKDRLRDKLTRLLEHQSTLTRHPRTAEMLHHSSINELDDLIFLRGYLFYPVDLAGPSLPASIAPEHSRGHWLTLSRARTTAWDPQRPIMQLHKPDWLGPLQCLDGDLADTPQLYGKALEQVASRNFPLLFARLSRQQSGFWLETERFFVVPDQWPEQLA